MADGILKRGDKWVARPYDAVTGQARWLGTFDSHKDARLAVAAFRLQRAAPAKVAWSVFAEEWLSQMQPIVRPRTYADYKTTCGQITDLLGDIPIGAISTRRVEDMVAKSSRTYAGNTTRKQLTRMRQMLDAAVRWGWLPANPARARIPLPKPRKRQVVPLTPQEAVRLVKAADPYYRPLLITAMQTGLRAGELFGLAWDDIDGGTLTVRRALTDGRLAEPKSEAARRTVVLTPDTISALEAHQAVCPHTDRGFVFPAPWGAPMNSHTWSVVMRKIAEDAKMPGVRLHDLRHCYASLLIRSGASAKLVQSLLGHSTITVTMDTYGHLFPDEKGKAAASVADYFGSISVAEDDAEAT